MLKGTSLIEFLTSENKKLDKERIFFEEKFENISKVSNIIDNIDKDIKIHEDKLNALKNEKK
jgi:hypothetical protein